MKYFPSHRILKSCSQKFTIHLNAVLHWVQVTEGANGFTFQIINLWIRSGILTWFDCNSVGSFFFQTRKQHGSNDVMNRKYILNPNEIVFMCFDKRPLVLCYAFKLCKHYNSFQSFFHTILYRFTAQNFVLCKFTYSCHLVFPCKSWLCIWLVNWNLKEFSFSVIIIDWLKNVPFFLNLVPRTPENAS